MKKKFISILLSLSMAVTTLALPVTGAELVSSDISDKTIVEESIEAVNSDEETETEEIVIEESAEDEAGTETVTVDEITGDDATTENTVSEAKEVSAESDYVLTEEQKEDKALLYDNLNKTFGIDESISAESIIKGDVVAMSSVAGVGHAENEIVYMTDTKEDAERVAKLYGGKLDSYSYKVAVIKLPETVSAFEAVCMSADPDTNLPMVCPNSVRTLSDATTSSKTDPYLNKSAGLKYLWNIDYVGARQAWEMGYKGQGIRVAVIDSGVQQSHIDLKKNTTNGYTFYKGKNGKKKTTGYFDHGTHVAGIICADDNGKLGTGVAPDSKVTSFAIFGPTGLTYDSDILRAINAVTEKGVFQIINMSFGGPDYDVNMLKALTDAKNSGIALFAAAGNENTSAIAYPAGFNGIVMSVASITWQGTRSDFTNYGSSVDINFPGSDIYSTSMKNNNKYIYKSGTSMATPMAAGVAAVILSARPDLVANKSANSVDTLYNIMQSNVIKERDNGGKYIGVGTTYLPKVFGNFTPITSIDITVPEKVKRGKTFTLSASVTPENATTKGIRYINSSASYKYFTIKGNKVTVKAKTPVGQYTIYACTDDHSIFAQPVTVNVVK